MYQTTPPHAPSPNKPKPTTTQQNDVGSAQSPASSSETPAPMMIDYPHKQQPISLRTVDNLTQIEA